MLLFKKYTNEMFLEDNKKNKLSKKHYKLFITDLIENLPTILNLEKKESTRESYCVSIMLSYYLEDSLINLAFEGLELNRLYLYLGYSNSLEEVEYKILNKFIKDYELNCLKTILAIEDIKIKYEEKYKPLITMIQKIKKYKKIIMIYNYKNYVDKSEYYKNPKKGCLSFQHIIYTLIDEFIYKTMDSNHKRIYDIIEIITEDNQIIYNGSFVNN